MNWFAKSGAHRTSRHDAEPPKTDVQERWLEVSSRFNHAIEEIHSLIPFMIQHDDGPRYMRSVPLKWAKVESLTWPCLLLLQREEGFEIPMVMKGYGCENSKSINNVAVLGLFSRSEVQRSEDFCTGSKA